MSLARAGSRLEGLNTNARQRVGAAAQALEAGRLAHASQALQPVLMTNPEHPEVLRLHAGMLGLRGRHMEAVQVMRRALAQRPLDALYHNTLGTLLGNAGEFDGAVAALRYCCELEPKLGLAWFNLGIMLTRCVRNNEAASALHRAVAVAPDDLDARALLADLLRTTGDTRAATAEYRRLIAARPATGMAWWGLAELRTAHFSDADRAQMQVLLVAPATGDDDRIAIGFALARALDQAGRYGESLAALERAHAIGRERQQWDAAAFSRSVAAIESAFTPAPPAVQSGLGREVIFIVGLPRSGSTLVEQILASHSRVEGAGELPDLPLVLAEESRRRGQPFPEWVGAMQPEDWARLGQRYLERTAHWRRDRPVALDKLPSNWLYIDAIRAMLPSARVVVCRRDRLETCFSCYRQHLANSEYTRSFVALAAFWSDFDRSVWREQSLHPQHVYQHHHEALQAQPEAQIRKLLDFCGLPFEEGCVHFHQSGRAVRSPSASQVRQPLQTDTAHAPRYGVLLDPLRAALGLPL